MFVGSCKNSIFCPLGWTKRDVIMFSRIKLESLAREGDSPVREIKEDTRAILSRVGHVKSGLNPGGPPSKAKQMQRSIADSTVRER